MKPKALPKFIYIVICIDFFKSVSFQSYRLSILTHLYCDLKLSLFKTTGYSHRQAPVVTRKCNFWSFTNLEWNLKSNFLLATMSYIIWQPMFNLQTNLAQINNWCSTYLVQLNYTHSLAKSCSCHMCTLSMERPYAPPLTKSLPFIRPPISSWFYILILLL